MRRATGAAAIPRPAGGGRGRAGGGGPARVVLAAPAGNPAEALGRRLGAAVVTDPGAGPLAALAAALAALHAPHVLALAADHPCLQVGPRRGGGATRRTCWGCPPPPPASRSGWWPACWPSVRRARRWPAAAAAG